MRALHALAAIALLASASCRAPSTSRREPLDLSRHFGGARGCFALLDVEAGTLLEHDPARCRERFAPCSTFKIANSLIGLETGAVSGPDELFRWDGVASERPETNRDHTLRSAIEASVVWVYQEVARRIGAERMQRFLDAIPYGNRDISAGIAAFWLGSSLAISAEEQVEFLRRLRTGDLPFSKRSMETVRDLILLERAPGAVLRGKTGSNRGSGGHDLGWFVGWVERGERAWVFAVNVEGEGTFGSRAREIARAVLAERGILEAPPGLETAGG